MLLHQVSDCAAINVGHGLGAHSLTHFQGTAHAEQSCRLTSTPHLPPLPHSPSQLHGKQATMTSFLTWKGWEFTLIKLQLRCNLGGTSRVKNVNTELPYPPDQYRLTTLITHSANSRNLSENSRASNTNAFLWSNIHINQSLLSECRFLEFVTVA